MVMSLVRAVEGHTMAHGVLRDAEAARLLMQVRRSELLFQLCEAECLHHDAHIVQTLDVHLRATAQTRKEATLSV